MLLFLATVSVAKAEQVADFIKHDSEDIGQKFYLIIHNNHGSKGIKVTKVQIWYSKCSKVSADDKGRIYKIDKVVNPYSERRFLVTNRFTAKGRYCYQPFAKFTKPYSVSRNITLKKSKDESWFKWWYLLAIPLFGLVAGFYDDYKKNTSRNKKSNINKASTSSEELTGDLFDDLLFGRYSLPLSYWIWFVLVNGVVSGIAFYFAEVKDNLFYLLPALLSNVVTSVGTWNSSTNYQLQKIKEKKTYGWGYAAKVSVIINALNMIGQSIVLINS